MTMLAVERPYQTVNIDETASCSKALALFRDTLAGLGFPWIVNFDPEKRFFLRHESLKFQTGSISLISVSPHRSERGRKEIARSTDADGIGLAYIFSGEALVEQSGREVIGSPGDIMIFDHAEPARIRQRSLGSYDLLLLHIPKSKFANVMDKDLLFLNKSISARHISRPLAACLTSIAAQMRTGSFDELAALYDASALLLPPTTARLQSDQFLYEVMAPNRALREILRFIDANIADAALSPQWVAEHVGISARHLHRQFALAGITFSSYVVRTRLDHICRELSSDAGRKINISEIAFRWGFNDLSTFIRTFKKRTGCTPREYRMTHFS